MSKSNPVYAFLSHNKYWIVLIVGILIVGVLDENTRSCSSACRKYLPSVHNAAFSRITKSVPAEPSKPER